MKTDAPVHHDDRGPRPRTATATATTTAIRDRDRDPRAASATGFTLLELIVAFAILAMFILPLLEVVHAARMRAANYSRDRAARELAQRKLYDRVYSIEVNNQGNFEAEGRPDWTWEYGQPQVVSQGKQLLLQHEIVVHTQPAGGLSDDDLETPRSSGSASGDYRMSIWAFPTREWLDYFADLEAQGLMPGMGGMGMEGAGMLPGGFGGF